MDDDSQARRELLKPTDVEAQTSTMPSDSRQRQNDDNEYTIPARTKLIYLAVYFFFNLSLTIYNKFVLGQFRYPWLLTALHSASAALGCYGLMLKGYFRLTKLTRSENMTLVAFSFLFTINIAMSNVSLAMVSVPFHQIMRSTCPVFTIIIYRVFYGRSYATSTYLSLIPLILGVGLATYGDIYFTTVGFVFTLIGVLLAAIKTVATNRLMTGSLALPALEVLLRMSPLAMLQSLLYAALTGEASKFASAYQAGEFTRWTVISLMGNGTLAFFLNVSSFQTNKLAGALTIAVCGNVKQCLTIILGIVLFHVQVGVWNGFGMLVALGGAAWYSKVELSSKMKKQQVAPQTSDSEKPLVPERTAYY
ncbi:TPT-domain-containing protein [Aulographum hederae CBS 113979]|uniref:TPT-domain-containing protein n=1 Tax=Aulographum hederae CBS 113979 TaxID=1176131 RepID=A0A6G1H0I7_9PEZI|nr:TPT-domain-containing protein [Aulographum hederae CBS 113979]